MEINIQTNDAEKVWKTSVAETINIFRDALVALVPIMDRAHISYEEHEQYDDYDAIADVLYEQIVINSIRWAFYDSQEMEIPAYGFEFDSDKHNAFIEVAAGTESNQEQQYVFKYFSSTESLFDTVVYYPFDKAQSLFSGEPASVLLKICSFQLRYKRENEFDLKSELSVLL